MGLRNLQIGVESTEHLIWCGDDETLRSLKLKGFSYGFGNHNDLQIENYCQIGWKNIFDIFFEGIRYAEIEIPLIGGHNVLNAAARLWPWDQNGYPRGIGSEEAFANFKGVNRRAGVERGVGWNHCF